MELRAGRARVTRLAMEKRPVFLDPAGVWPAGWLVVVVAHPTGVRYEQQCAGVARDQRAIEGYLVPVGGPKVNPEEGVVDAAELRAVFHDGSACDWTMTGDRLRGARLEELRALVGAVPFWTRDEGGSESRGHLLLDGSRLADVAEAWVPVLTPEGAGVLLWGNCD